MQISDLDFSDIDIDAVASDLMGYDASPTEVVEEVSDEPVQEDSEEVVEDSEVEEVDAPEDDEDQDEQEVEEVKEEAKPAPRLAGLIRREKALREAQSNIENKSKELEQKQAQFEEKASKFDLKEIESMDSLIREVKEGKPDSRAKLMEMVGVDSTEILKWSIMNNPAWVKENLKDIITELEGKFDPSASKLKSKEAEIKAREDELNRLQKAREEEAAYQQRRDRVLSSASRDLVNYPICAKWDQDALAADLQATVNDMYSRGLITGSDQLPDILSRILPVLEQRYEDSVNPIVSAVQSKRAKLSASKSKEVVRSKQSEKQEAPKKQGKTLKTKSAASTAKKTGVDLRNLSRSDAIKALAEEFDLESAMNGF